VRPSQTQIQSYVVLGDLDMQVKDTGAAITHLQKALQLDPAAADALVSLGDAQLAKGRAKNAVASYKAALQYIPGYGPELDGLKHAQGGR
jgi:cytochrome c-type biogenesis protein CcmH/NrfG